MLSSIQNSPSKLYAEQLQYALNQFGLNPTDWRLEFHDHKYVLITHRQETDFQFIGKITSARNNWEYIKLFNL